MKVMSFAGAVDYFRDKVAMTPDEFSRLVDEIGDWANSQAFTVTRVASADVLQGIYDEVLKAIKEGTTFFEFREGIDALMERLGWEGLSPYRLDNIMRTNVQSAYNVGRYKKMKAVADRRPYWEYDAVNDADTRKTHLAHDGKIYHHTHVFWDTWYPLNGYRCRCRVNSLSLAEMEEEGLKEETQGTDLKPDKGFQYNPAEKKWKPDAEKYDPRLKAQMEEALWD